MPALLGLIEYTSMKWHSAYALASLALLSVSPLAAQPGEPAKEPVGAPVPPQRKLPTHQGADGLKVTPLDTEPNDLADILDVDMWNFKLEEPDTGMKVRFTLEVREKGKDGQQDKVLETLGSNTVPFPAGENDGRVAKALVALHRQDGLWRWFVRIAGSTISNTTRALDDFNATRGTEFPPPYQQDGSFLLVTFRKAGVRDNPEPAPALLVLTFQLVEDE